MVICPQCGKNTPEGKFCEHCGAQVQTYQSPSVIPPAPQPKTPYNKRNIAGLAAVVFVILIVLLGIVYINGTKPIPTKATSASEYQWAGTYDTNWGIMKLIQSGNAVTGTYEYKDGRISGTVSGTTFTGTWSEGPSYQPPDQAGDVTLKLSTGGTELSGQWRYGFSGAWSGDWNGIKIAKE